MKNRGLSAAVALLTCVALATPQRAEAQVWANWNAASCGTGATGSFGSATVSYSGGFAAMQDASGADLCGGISQSGGKGNNYWTVDGTAASGAYSVVPDNVSFIQYIGQASGTITFSEAVVNPYIALISVGQPSFVTTLTFSDPFSIVSRNNTLGTLAYWDVSPDTDSFIDGNSLVATEFSGLIQFQGTFTQLTISTTGENWHGFSVGAQSVSVVPEPSSMVLMGLGLAGMIGVARRRRSV